MKKVCVLVLIQLLVFGTASYGAVSDDIYVRKDVFEAYMQRFDDKLNMILRIIREQREEHKAQISELKDEIKEIREEQKAQRKDINSLSNRVSELAGRVEGLDARLGDLRNDIYLGLVILGIIVGLPAVQKIFQSLADRKPSITIEDVKRLIEENNMKLSGKTQV